VSNYSTIALDLQLPDQALVFSCDSLYARCKSWKINELVGVVAMS
jgi:hypothetical protein